MAVGSMHKNRLERRLANQQRGIVASTYSTVAGPATSGTGTITPTPSPAPTQDPTRNPVTGKKYGASPEGSGIFGPTSGDFSAKGITGGRQDDRATDYRNMFKKEPVRRHDKNQPWYQNER